jgi:hypothetical protein
MLSMACDNKPKGQVQRCVDANDWVVDDDKCDQQQPATPYHGPYAFYRWYYGGSGFWRGQQAEGGGFVPAPDRPSFRATSPEGSAIIRGGFGGGFADGVGS